VRDRERAGRSDEIADVMESYGTGGNFWASTCKRITGGQGDREQ